MKDIETRDAVTQFLYDINTQKELLSLKEEDEEKLEKLLMSEDKKVREDAINKIFILNAKLVMFFAKGYFGKGYSTDDIVANGNIGLLEGIKRFDPNKQFKLSTYVSWYIKKYILKYMEENDLIRVPSYLNNDYLKYTKTKEQMSIELGRVPEDEEIAAALDMPMDKIDKIKSCKYSMSSLDMKLSDEEDSDTLSEIIPDENVEDPLEIMNHEALCQALNLVLEDLMPNEKQVIEYRFGLNNQPVLTLGLIGEKMNLSSERIRQIENSALRKLRNKARKKILQPFIME